MVKIEIVETAVATREFADRQTGEVVTYRRQVAYLHRPGEPYPERVELPVRRDQPPYPAGMYVLGDESFRVFRGRIELRPVLLPASERPASVKSA